LSKKGNERGGGSRLGVSGPADVARSFVSEYRGRCGRAEDGGLWDTGTGFVGELSLSTVASREKPGIWSKESCRCHPLDRCVQQIDI